MSRQVPSTDQSRFRGGKYGVYMIVASLPILSIIRRLAWPLPPRERLCKVGVCWALQPIRAVVIQAATTSWLSCIRRDLPQGAARGPRSVRRLVLITDLLEPRARGTNRRHLIVCHLFS